MHIEVEITALAHGGAGIGRVDGQVCFVPFALPGERVRARVVQRRKNLIEARLVEVLEASPDRTEYACADQGHGGACAWDHLAYPAQAAWKRRIAAEQIARIGGIALDLEWTEDPALRRGYRTRAEFHGDGTQLGFHALGTHDIVDTAACSLCHPRLNEALARLRACALRGTAMLTVNPDDGETLLWAGRLTPELRAAFPNADQPGQRESRARFAFDGIPIVNGCFAQSSLLLNRLLVRAVHDALGGAARVLDLYCGNGNLSLGLPAAEVCGYDHNRHAVEAARSHSGREYLQGGEPEMAAAIGDTAWDAIVLDPPRTGAKALAPTLAGARAGRIVYVSCDPATLGRDLRTIAAGGWRVARAAALDLFPHTPHIETLAVLERA